MIRQTIYFKTSWFTCDLGTAKLVWQGQTGARQLVPLVIV